MVPAPSRRRRRSKLSARSDISTTDIDGLKATGDGRRLAQARFLVPRDMPSDPDMSLGGEDRNWAADRRKGANDPLRKSLAKNVGAGSVGAFQGVTLGGSVQTVNFSRQWGFILLRVQLSRWDVASTRAPTFPPPRFARSCSAP